MNVVLLLFVNISEYICSKQSFCQSGERGKKLEQSPMSTISANTHIPLMAQSVNLQYGKPVNGCLQRLYWKQPITTAYRQLRNSASGKQMRNPWRKATGLAHQGMYRLTTRGMMMNSLATWWISSAFWQTVSTPSTMYLTVTSQTQKRQVMARNSLLRWSVKRWTLVEGCLSLLRQATRKGTMPSRLMFTHRLLAMQQCLCQSICIPDYYYKQVRPSNVKAQLEPSEINEKTRCEMGIFIGIGIGLVHKRNTFAIISFEIGEIRPIFTKSFLTVFSNSIKIPHQISKFVKQYDSCHFSLFIHLQSNTYQPFNSMSKLDPQALKAYIQDKYESLAVPSLIQYIKIDNLSRVFDAEWHTNGKLEAAANHIRDWVLSLNIQRLTIEVIKDQGYAPLIFTQIQGDIPNTLFFYGHYDKQPPFQGWMEGVGPTNPKIIDGKLYGRGGADDGYSTYSTMLALKALQEQGVKLPRCVMITEGDEESGSGHMKHYLETLKQRIGDPFAFFCLDSGTLDYDRVWLSTSLRGHLLATLRVTANLQGIHSGTYGGVIPSVHRIARLLLNRIENYQTGEFNPKFKTDITPARYQENVELAKYMGSTLYDCFPLHEGTQPISTNPLVSLLKRNWHPTLTVTGQTGIPPVEGAGNILHPSTQVRISIRLPPNFPVEKAESTLKEILLTDVPYGAKAELLNLRASTGWNATEYEPYFVSAVKDASDIFYGNKMISFGEGGTIPLMGLLQNMWPGRQFLITGVLGPHSNAHGPNEFLHIDYVKKLTCCLSYVVAKCSEHLEQQ